MKKEIILIGGGGHCVSCIDVIERTGHYRIAGIVDKKDRVGSSVNGYKVIGTDDDIKRLCREYRNFIITLGQIESCARRRDIYRVIKRHDVVMPVIVSPMAYVSERATLGEGTIVFHRAFVNALASVGSNCIINTGSIVEHGSSVEDHCHISTSSVINGECRVGEGALIGSGAVLLNGVSVARGIVVGAGSVVVRSIASSGTYAGNPARRIMKR